MKVDAHGMPLKFILAGEKIHEASQIDFLRDQHGDYIERLTIGKPLGFEAVPVIETFD